MPNRLCQVGDNRLCELHGLLLLERLAPRVGGFAEWSTAVVPAPRPVALALQL